MIWRPLAYADAFLIWFFMRISHWVDYRLHVNQYRLAAWVMHAALALMAAGYTQRIIADWRFAALWVPAGSILIWMYGQYSGMMYKASAAYERRPDEIPRAAYVFLLMAPGVRLMALAMASLLCWVGLLAPHPKLDVPWYVVATISWYIASGLPPRRERKKKKQRTPWAALLLRPVRSS